MANPNHTGADAVGSYRDPAAARHSSGSSALGWIIGLLLLLGLLLLALWAFGAFSGDNDTGEQPITTYETAPAEPTALPEDGVQTVPDATVE